MATNFVLTTDTSCDIFRSDLDQMGVPWIPLYYNISGEDFQDTFSSDEQYREFYQKIRDGVMPTTSQINIYDHEVFFEGLAKNGASKIIHLPLSGGLSSTVESAKQAAKNIMENYPDVQIYILDTLSATQGHRMLVDKGVKLRNEGASFDDAIAAIEKCRDNLNHWIIVDDLHHLRRGGRVSGASAYIGSMLKIKPILVIDKKGKLEVVKKCKGTTKAIKYVSEMVQKYIADDSDIVLANADGDDKIEEMKKVLTEIFPTRKISIGWVGPVIGAHTGCDMIGIVFEGKERPEF